MKKYIKEKATTFGTVTQAHFLKNLGVDLRLHVSRLLSCLKILRAPLNLLPFQRLLEDASEEEKKDLASGVQMLMKDMGERFKFLSLFPRDCKQMFQDNPPAGFV